MQGSFYENEIDLPGKATDRIWSVSEVSAQVRNLFDSEPKFRFLRVRGEVTNVSKSQAGHVYFGLKDKNGYLKCVAFKSSAVKLKVQPSDGREAIATGRLGVWEAGGSYQLYVDDLADIGYGALWLQFEETRNRLQEEGLFDEDKKRPLPEFPELIGLVTSRDGAALRDMLRIFNDRAPWIRCILSPSLVQGETAPASLISALNLLEMWDEIEKENVRRGLDLIIIGRGGGSFEDLACFNDEKLARRIRETKVPIISAVGHEVDFTIADFVADLRAATPTQAAGLSVPDVRDLLQDIVRCLSEFRQAADIKIDTYRTGLSNVISRTVYLRPVDRIYAHRQNLDNLTSGMAKTIGHKLSVTRHRLDSLSTRLDALNPEAILSRGYSLAFRRDDKKLVRSVSQVSEGDEIDLRVSDGSIPARITGEEKKK